MPSVYLTECTYHMRLFRGPSTNDMKKEDGSSGFWPTPHTTPLFLPPEDPSPVLLCLVRGPRAAVRCPGRSDGELAGAPDAGGTEDECSAPAARLTWPSGLVYT
jgi:hypothetical protein